MPQHRNEMERLDSIILRTYGSHGNPSVMQQAFLSAAERKVNHDAAEMERAAAELRSLQSPGWSVRV